MVAEINDLIRRIRGKDSLRDATKKTGVSYTYWSILEKGIDPRTKSPIKPTPDTLRAISTGYRFPYEELMRVAGYIEENKTESAETLSESEYDFIIRETELKYGVNLRDDPFVVEAMKQIIESYAKSKQNR